MTSVRPPSTPFCCWKERLFIKRSTTTLTASGHCKDGCAEQQQRPYALVWKQPDPTGTYGDALAEFLYSCGHTISVVNPARIHSYAKSRLSRNKTDKGDSHLIALFYQSEQPKAWHPSPPEVKELQALVRRLESLVQMRVQENNRSKANAHPAVQASLAQMLISLDTQIKALRKAIREQVRAYPMLLRQFELLMSIVGIGDKTAYKLLAEIDVANFKDVKALAVFLGLTPRHHTSGMSI